MGGGEIETLSIEVLEEDKKWGVSQNGSWSQNMALGEGS